jgi:hypothetical protein
LQKTAFQPFSVDVAADVTYSIPIPGHVLAAKNVLVIEDDAGLEWQGNGETEKWGNGDMQKCRNRNIKKWGKMAGG